MRERMETLLAGDLDWGYLIEIALGHRVAPLLFHTLRSTGARGVPGDLTDALALYCEDNRERNAHLARTLIAIVNDLEGEAVSIIPLKGPTLAALAYGDLALRNAGDLDFLVREAHLSKVCGALAAQGFREPEESGPVLRLRPAVQAAYRTYQCELLFVRDRDHVTIEPHWALVPKTLAVPIDHDGLWERAGSAPFNGAQILSLTVEDLLLFLCVHGSKHQWTRLQWVCDIAELIAARPGLDWSACLERARIQGCERMLLLGLTLANRLLGSGLPDEIARALEADAVAVSLAELACARMFLDGNQTPSISKVSPFRMRMRERVRDKFLYVVRTIATPTLDHFAAVYFPDRLFLLYYPFKLIHDYVALPAWIASRPLRERGSGPHISPDAAAQTKRAVRATWGARSEYWVRWADDQARSARRLNDLLLDAAGVSAGQTVLDLASGAGETAVTAVRRIAGDGRVVALDLAPEMAAATRDRGDAFGPGALQCCAADMEALPFADGCFDSVVCRLGIMFCPRPEVALAETHRVLKPGARAAFLTWGPIEENPSFDVVHRVVGRYLDRVSEANEPAAFRFSAPGRLAKLIRGAGFADVEDRQVRHDDVNPAGRKFWRPILEMSYGMSFNDLPPSVSESLDRRLEDAFAAYLEEDGYHLRTTMRLVVGRRRSP